MIHTGQIVKAFLDGQSQAFEALMDRSLADGIAHAEEELGVTAKPRDEDVRSAKQRLISFYIPSLIRIHGQLLNLIANDGDVNAWLDANLYRIELAIEGILWSGAEAGYALSASMLDGVELYWVLDNSVAEHCSLCPVFADGSPYRGFNALPAWPGDGTTPCGGNCYCLVIARKPPSDL